MRKNTNKLTEDYLEYHIDEPIRNVIAMLNLLDIPTKFCCCGFDYEGQPEFKDHVYGYTHVYVDYSVNPEYVQKLVKISQESDWVLTYRNVASSMSWCLSYDNRRNGFWDKKDSVHFHEKCVVGIFAIEECLMKFKHLFKDRTVLEDTNHHMIQSYGDKWQYRGKKPWVITKEYIRDLETNMEYRKNHFVSLMDAVTNEIHSHQTSNA